MGNGVGGGAQSLALLTGHRVAHGLEEGVGVHSQSSPDDRPYAYRPVGELLRCGEICYDIGIMKRVKEYNPDQQLLLPPDLNDWLEEGHLAYFIRDVVGELALSAIYADYESRPRRAAGLRPADDG